MSESLPEMWLRGPVPGVPPLLQPVAHSLLQAREEVESLTDGFPDDLLWARPGGVAPAGFHLRHITGVVDRLFTYARGEPLAPEQLEHLGLEGGEQAGDTVGGLASAFRRQVELALDQLRSTPEPTLPEARDVGRARLPSTVAGLLFHAAEHTQRHVGQLLVTTRVVLASSEAGQPGRG
jgi:uncharacterized damage-inducible protein DinB